MPPPTIEQCCLIAARFYRYSRTHPEMPDDGTWRKGVWYLTRRLPCCLKVKPISEHAHAMTYAHAKGCAKCPHKGNMKHALVIAALQDDT